MVVYEVRNSFTLLRWSGTNLVYQYQVLTGAPPFASRGKPELVFQAAIEGKCPPRPSTSESIGITNEVWDLLGLCWARDVSSRPTVKHVVNRLEVAVKHWTADPVTFLLASETGVQTVMNMEHEKIQKFANDLDKVRRHASNIQHNRSSDPQPQALDRIGVSKNTKKYLRCLQNLCGVSGVLPQSFALTEVPEGIDKYPSNTGGFSDIYRATYKGCQVAVKALRIDALGDPDLTRRVCFIHPRHSDSSSPDETDPCEGGGWMEVASPR